jgi:hypothetical protein
MSLFILRCDDRLSLRFERELIARVAIGDNATALGEWLDVARAMTLPPSAQRTGSSDNIPAELRQTSLPRGNLSCRMATPAARIFFALNISHSPAAAQ